MDRNIRRGDIFWIRQDSGYLSELGVHVQRGNRPAIIVSNDKANMFSSVLEVVYLTTADKKDMPTHVTIRSAKEVSTALCEQISTIGVEAVDNYIGRCTEQEMAAIDSCLLISLGIDGGQHVYLESPEDEEIRLLRKKVVELEADVFSRDQQLETLEDQSDEVERLKKEIRGLNETIYGLHEEIDDLNTDASATAVTHDIAMREEEKHLQELEDALHNAQRENSSLMGKLSLMKELYDQLLGKLLGK